MPCKNEDSIATSYSYNIVHCQFQFFLAMFFQLYARYCIDRSKTLKFILIPYIVRQLSDVNYGHPL